MAAGSNVAPVIIKRKKIVEGGGHHGGAWKVAYADFVTAMMAFFLLMWLLNATTEQQRKGLADYFSPSVPVSPVSGGGDGAFGGSDIFSERVLPQNGIGATLARATESDRARGLTGDAGAEQQAAIETVEEALTALAGESDAATEALRHIITRVTDEGLVIELFAIEGSPLFDADTASPAPITADIVALLARVFDLVENDVAVAGHMAARPVVLQNNPVWGLSTARADRVRGMLKDAGLAPGRVQRVTGHADREPAVADPMAVRNNRIEVTLLRSDI